jgi:hypothetical protein
MIYILEEFDQWDEWNPWNLAGYTTDIELARKWKDAYKGRRFRCLTELKI